MDRAQGLTSTDHGAFCGRSESGGGHRRFLGSTRAMTIGQIIAIALQASIALTVFSIALNATFDDVTSLVRRPGLLARSLLAMFVIMPVLAVALAVLFDLNPVVEVALIALALAPVPPILPNKELKAGGSTSYAMALLATSALLSIAIVPAAVALLGWIFGREVHVEVPQVLKIALTSVLLPLVAGIVVRRLVPSAGNWAKAIGTVATVVLVAGALPILVKEWSAIAALFGNFSVAAVAAFGVVGLAIGPWMGGPDPGERTVLALSTASRHPAMALAVTHGLADQNERIAAVLLAVLVTLLVSAPYVRWRARARAVTSETGA